MSLIQPNLERVVGARIVLNALDDSADPALLTQDLLLVELQGGKAIDVSWVPEHDPSGRYYVTVFDDDREYAEVCAADALEAARLVRDLALAYTQEFWLESCSSGQVVEYQPAA